MMAPVEEDAELLPHPGGEDNNDDLQTQDKRPEIQREGNDNNDDELDPEQAPSRQLSDAARRDDREAQRATQQQRKQRRSLLNNRFLQRNDSRAGGESSNSNATREQDTNGAGAGGGGGGESASRSPRWRQDRKSQKQPEHNDDEDNDGNDDDDALALRVVEEKALVVTRKRSAAAGHDKTRAQKRDDDETTDPLVVVVTPRAHVVPALALQRSKWTAQLNEDAACGLFVDHALRKLAQIASSTLRRLDERLQRERKSSALLRLQDLVHVSQPLEDDCTASSSHRLCSTSTPTAAATTVSAAPRRSTSRAPWATAILEIAIDRLVLDDHVAFSLADRIETQLRSLFVSYTQLLHAQPWAPLLQRVDAYVEAQLLVQTASTACTAWRAQTQLDAQALLQALSTLQQLHYRLLAKWHELQDCYRQPTLPLRATKLRVRQQPRAQSLSVATVRAFLELGDGESSDDESATQKLSQRLDALEIKDQFLHNVLQLEGVAVSAYPSAAAVSSSSPRGGVIGSLASCLRLPLAAAPPRFFAVLLINGKEVGRTKAASWTMSGARVGVVAWNEILRTQLQFFPDAVALQVVERGLLADTLLSTTSIPLLVPGSDRVGHAREARHRVAAASLAPAREWYQFSSVRPMRRAQWHATFLNSSLFATFQRRPHGRVRVHAAWVAPPLPPSPRSNQELELDASTHVVLPPRRLAVAANADATAKLVGPRVDRRRLYHGDDHERMDGCLNHKRGFAYERDFLVHVHDAQLALDRSDPQNAAAVRLQDHARAQSALLRRRDVFRTAALVADATRLLQPHHAPLTVGGRAALTRRNCLLQLRDREHVARHGTSVRLASSSSSSSCGPAGPRWTHAVFDEPLPLSEHAIASSAKFLSLLRPELPAFDRRSRLDDALADAPRSVERERKLQLIKLQSFVDRVRATHVARVHHHHQRSANPRERTRTLATIVQEQPLPLLPGAIDLSGLGGLFSRRRRLRPRVEARAAPATMADWPHQCMVYVQVKGATNLPVRVASAGSSSTTTTTTTTTTKPAIPRDSGTRALLNDDDDDHDHHQGSASPEPTTSSSGSNQPHVFVEVSFQGRRRRTTSTHARATGAVWMETVAFPFHAPQDDWSPDSLQKTPDVVRLSLFDQLVRGSSSADGGADDALLLLHDHRKTTHDAVEQTPPPSQQQQQREVQSFHQENRYLGCLEIPFAALYHNHGTLEATLRCEMPVANAGYVNAKHAADASDDHDVAASPRAATNASSATSLFHDDGVRQRSREATFLSVMMTLDPLLPLPVKAFEERGTPSASDDAAQLVAYATQWTSGAHKLNAATLRRDFHVFARSLGHGPTFLTRYVAPQTPPPLLAGDASKKLTVSQLVRFVQLIPFLDDWQLFGDGGELDVWTTSQELLELNAGDSEEHAVLLCNFLNWLDRDDANLRSLLVLATAVPEGKTVYVLRQDSYKIPQRSVLLNASSGVGYSVLDDRCPVLDVSLVVSSDNIYANIQPRKRLSEMNWDVETNPKAWKPFFHGGHGKEQYTLPSIQATALVYAETPVEFVKQVEGELRETLKLEIRRWRSAKFTTTFNMDLSLKLRAQLERLEMAMLHGTPTRAAGDKRRNKTTADGTADVIQTLQRTRRVSGMPLNSTFTDLHRVVAMVQNTNIYWNDHAQVEFGLAVYVHAYPNSVLSVWVYLVAVEPLD